MDKILIQPGTVDNPLYCYVRYKVSSIDKGRYTPSFLLEVHGQFSVVVAFTCRVLYYSSSSSSSNRNHHANLRQDFNW